MNKVICVNNENIKYLTLGKEYLTTDSDDDMVCVINDDGIEVYYNKNRFIHKKETTSTEKVNHPNHYNKGIEVIDYINSWSMDFLEGNIIKYVSRYKYKNGMEDLKKAKQYLDWLIEREDNKND